MHVKDGRLVETGVDVAVALQDATELARRARRDNALALLTHCEDWPEPLNEQGLLVRADVLARRDPVLALEALAAHADAFASPAGRFGYLAISAFAYVNSRNFDAAREMLAGAQELVQD